MNDRSSQQIFNFDPRISSPSYHLSKGFDPRSLTNSPSSFNMSNSIHFTPNSSKLFEENNQNQMPNYNSLKIEQDKNKFIKKENTLSRQRSMNGYNMQKNYNGYDRKTMESESKHEHCLNWLEAGNSYEKESKVVDANIQLLMWKKRHLEILQKQKTKVSLYSKMYLLNDVPKSLKHEKFIIIFCKGEAVRGVSEAAGFLDHHRLRLPSSPQRLLQT